MRITYERWNPRGEAIDIIAKANAICQELKAQGYDITLRQLYYQFVSRDWLPNNQKSYTKLGNIVNKARLAGMMDWDFLIDRTRNLESVAHWRDPSEAIYAIADQFRIDKWNDQPTRIEVWVEKEALAGVVERAAFRNDVAYFSCRGYVSQSEQWAAAQRLGQYIEHGQNIILLHLGDHDPSGLDMTRDIRERLSTFIEQDYLNEHPEEFGSRASIASIRNAMEERCGGRGWLTVNRIALNMDQVEEYNPPPNPAKLTDTRADKYIEEFGDESWELDALSPAVIDALIDDAILEAREDDSYAEREATEHNDRALLSDASYRWTDIVEFLEG